MGMGSERARDPMFEQPPGKWVPRVCALTSGTVREWLQVGKNGARAHDMFTRLCRAV
jgi:hypothetical protein